MTVSLAPIFGPPSVLSFYEQIYPVSKRANHQELMTICPTDHTITSVVLSTLTSIPKIPTGIEDVKQEAPGKKRSHLIHLTKFNAQII